MDLLLFEGTLQKEIYLCLKEVSLFVKFPGQVFEERISMAASVTVILLHMFFLCLDLLWSAQIANHYRENGFGYLGMQLTYGEHFIHGKPGFLLCISICIFVLYVIYMYVRVRVCGWLGGCVLTRTSM